MLLQRAPHPALRPFVALLWVSDNGVAAPYRSSRERVLPTGAMHLVFRLSEEPLRLYDDACDQVPRSVGHCIVGGARASAYVRDISTPSRSVGALLHPGAARLLFGGSAAELAGKHTRLDDLWGRSASEIRERLLEARAAALRSSARACRARLEARAATAELHLFETLLLARLPRVRGLHPAVAEGLSRLADRWDVRSVVTGSGYSHRRFIALFEDAVGLTPKRYSRVVRFGSVLRRLVAEPEARLVEVALDAGYGDQAHFNRDFREITGMSPSRYRATAPKQPHHVPIVGPE